MEYKNYNLYVLAIPSDEDGVTPGLLTQANTKYVLCAKTEKINEEVLCKLVKEMYHSALEVQNDRI